MEFIQQLDLSILLFIQEHLRFAWMNGFWEFITHFGDGGIFWIVLTLALMIPKRTRKAGIVAACSLLLGFLITNVTLKPLVDRVRPYNYSDVIIPLGRIPVESSFPSGHTCASFACALIYVRMLPKKCGISLLVLAVLISLSRLYLCVHFPTDVLGGFLVALFSSMLVYGCYQQMEQRKKKEGGR
ncbi:MAG: phosphatase PAP2 family protein [Lachnospiraceae bacterium]|nr:phosphatase PAP2 family protein [Lachnospiraceae bacterium]